MDDTPAGHPAPRQIGFPFAAGLVVVVGMLMVATFLPWIYTVSGWDMLTLHEILTGFAWWVPLLVPVTAILTVVALALPNRLARLPLVLVTATGAIALFVSPEYVYLLGPGWGIGLTIVGFPAAFLFATVLFLRPAWRLRPPNRATTVVGVVVAVVSGGIVAAISAVYLGQYADAGKLDLAPAPGVPWHATGEWNLADRPRPLTAAGVPGSTLAARPGSQPYQASIAPMRH